MSGRSYIDRVVAEPGKLRAAYVYSAAMRRTIKVQLAGAESSSRRPTLYLLGGLGEQDPANSIWNIKTPVGAFFADKDVNVVLPIAGNGSMYTDWQRDDPKLGRYRWETFLTKELPR